MAHSRVPAGMIPAGWKARKMRLTTRIAILVVFVIMSGWNNSTGLHALEPRPRDHTDTTPTNTVFLPIVSRTHRETQPFSQLELVGQVGGVIFSMMAHGDYLYLGAGPRLVILNVSDPIHPVFVGQTEVLSDLAYNLAIDGNYAYIANGAGGLVIVNISNPSSPKIVARYPTPGLARDVTVAHGYAYVTSSTGLSIFEATFPWGAASKGFVNMSENVYGVRVTQDYAYVIDGDRRLHVINISNSADPKEIGSVEISINANQIELSAMYAYVFSLFNVDILDLTNPAVPKYVGGVGLSADNSGGRAISGTLLFIAGSTGLEIVDVSNPAAPIRVGLFPTTWNWRVAAQGTQVYVAGRYGGLRVIDVANPQHPVQASFYDVAGYAADVKVAGSYAYLAGWRSGLRIIDVVNPSQPGEVGFFTPDGFVFHVVISRGYAYTVGSLGLRIINVANPAAPFQTSLLPTTGTLTCIAVQGDYAYIGEANTALEHGLLIARVADPSNPSEISFLRAYAPRGIAVMGNYAYFPALSIYDIADPANPSQVGYSSYLSDSGTGVAIQGSYAYTTILDGSMQIFDISDPLKPFPTGTLNSPGKAWGIAVDGPYAFLADGESGLLVINIANPAAPLEIARYDTPGIATGVAVVGNLIYVADAEGGLLILRLK
ncbi:MAG: hypothetical protein EXR62_07980 [Chloroflexi bacterium]|nr:hypothetical protein [Chloroflexota bacterium]